MTDCNAASTSEVCNKLNCQLITVTDYLDRLKLLEEILLLTKEQHAEIPAPANTDPKLNKQLLRVGLLLDQYWSVSNCYLDEALWVLKEARSSFGELVALCELDHPLDGVEPDCDCGCDSCS